MATLDVNVGSVCFEPRRGLRVTSGRYEHLYESGEFIGMLWVRLIRTVTIRVRIHDEHQTVLHLLPKAHANPRVGRTCKVDEDITRVVCDVE